MDVVLVLLTIVGTLGAVGGAALAAARGADLWTPAAVSEGDAPRRVRRLVSVTRSGPGTGKVPSDAPGNGREAADGFARARSEAVRTEAHFGPRATASAAEPELADVEPTAGDA